MHNLKFSKPKKLILIGASTGGPGHISKIIAALKLPPDTSMIIAQHMGEEYIPSFTKRLNNKSQYVVKQSFNQDIIETSTIYIASNHCLINSNNKHLIFEQQNPEENRYNPDIDALFQSIALVSGDIKVLAIILTGIGDDGAQGCLQLVKNGSICLSESPETSIVDGMPMQVRKLLPQMKSLALDEIIKQINQF